MAEEFKEFSNTSLGFALGSILGAGTWTTIAILLDLDVALSTGFGGGIGIIIGLLTGRMVDREAGRTTRIVGLSAILSLGFVAILGAAWGGSTGLMIPQGAMIGGSAGALLGVAISLILSAREKRR